MTTNGRGRFVVIGLDCADPELVFSRWPHLLPHLRQVAASGMWGRLRSTIPPITVPAWAVMMTGHDPGQLGFYGFRNRVDYSYENLATADSRSVQVPAVWDLLGQVGRRSTVLGVPPGYPPLPLVGKRVGCFLTPGTDEDYTYPPELKYEIQRVVGDYMVDVDDFRTDDRERLLAEIHTMTERRFALAKHFLRQSDWDFFIMVEMGTDRIHHGFWQYFDTHHLLYEPHSPYETAIRDYYRRLDTLVGELMALLHPDDVVLILSDHGAKRMDGAICLNEWLIQNGYLKLHEYPREKTPFHKLKVDWANTVAWGEGGYYGRLFLNVKGREPQGVVDPAEYETVRDRLIDQLQSLGNERGEPIGTKVMKPEAIYAECRNIPSDLFVFFGDLFWRSIGSVGHGKIHASENDTGPDGANHDWDGIVLAARVGDLTLQPQAGGFPPQTRRDGLDLLDVAPTILAHFGLPQPAAMRGRPFSW